MDQIIAGILKNKQFPATSIVNGTKFDFAAKREEPVFDALLEQKKEQYSNDVVTEKPRKPETEKEEPTTKEVVKQEKPVESEEETETCDLAREVAVSQMVRFAEPNAEELLVSGPMEKVATIEMPRIFGNRYDPRETVEDFMMIMPDELSDEVKDLIAMGLRGRLSNQTATLEITDAPKRTVRAVMMPYGEVPGEGEETGAEGSMMQGPLFNDVEAAPIKVAEAPEKMEQSVPVEQQVTTKLTDLLTNGETRVQIQLEPIELGKLTIELTRSADGTLSILLDAESSQTRGLLEKSIGTLQDAMIERGQKVTQIIVEHNEESQRQENQQQHNDFNDGGNGHQQQEQQRRGEKRDSADFMQQLRLGLIPIGEDDN